MAAGTKSPGKSDSDNVLIWKAMTNIWILAHAEGYNVPKPTLGSSDQLLLRRGLAALLLL